MKRLLFILLLALLPLAANAEYGKVPMDSDALVP